MKHPDDDILRTSSASRSATTVFRQVEQTVKKDFLPFAGGRTGGTKGRILRAVMDLASNVFRAAVLFRNRLYLSGALHRRKLPIPSVSIGNIAVGGTGKTPFVEYTARLLRRLGRHPAVIARGYGPPVPGLPERVNDEGALLAHNLPGIPVLLSPDRVSAAFRAVELGADCAVLDDAFQHLRVLRDLDIVLIDATVPLGFGRVLPRGLLREPMRGLSRAHAVVINRSDLARTGDLAVLESVIARSAPGIPIFKAVQEPSALILLADGSSDSPRLLEDMPIGTFCGLGNPFPFGLTLRLLGADVVFAKRFPDHHPYSAEEIHSTAAAAVETGAKILVTTQKDAVKIPPDLANELPLPLFYLAIEARILDGEEIFLAMLRDAVTKYEETAPDACG